MRIKKIPMNGYVARLYKTKRYTPLLVSFMFELDYTKENIYLCDLLASYIFHTNKKYKTRKEISLEFKKNYDMRMSIDNYSIGEKQFLELHYCYFDPYIIKDDYLKDAIRFGSDMFFKPNFIDGKVDKNILEECKMKMVNSYGSHLANPNTKVDNEYNKRVLKESIYTIDLVDTKEEYKELLDSFTDEDIIYMYNHIINDCFVGCNLMGNFTDETLGLIKKYYKFKPRKLDANYNSIITFDNIENDILIKDDTIRESTLIATYKIDNYTIKDEQLYQAITMALNSVGMLMHRTLREEMKLVYSAGADFYKRSGFMTLTASIGKENKEKTLEGFDVVLKKLEDRDLVNETLIKIKREVELKNYTEDENYGRVFARMVNEDFKMREPLKKKTDNYMNLTANDIINGIKRLKRVSVYFYRGDK